MMKDEDKRFQQEALSAALELNKSVQSLSADTVKLAQHGKHTRHLIKLLALSVCFDLIISVVLGWVAIQALSARSDVHVSKVADYQTCLESNKIRLVQTELWATVLDRIGHDRLPETEELKELTSQTFQPRICNRP